MSPTDNDGGAFEETARDGSTYRLRLVVHDAQAYDWFYNVVANPMLWFLQHYLWDLATSPSIDHGVHHAWREGYVPVNRAFAEAVLDELDRDPHASVFFHDYHLYVAPRIVREARPDARSCTSSTSRGRGRTTGRCFRSRSGARSMTACSRTTSSDSTRGAGGATSCAAAEDIIGAVPDWANDALGYEGRRVSS